MCVLGERGVCVSLCILLLPQQHAVISKRYPLSNCGRGLLHTVIENQDTHCSSFHAFVLRGRVDARAPAHGSVAWGGMEGGWDERHRLHRPRATSLVVVRFAVLRWCKHQVTSILRPQLSGGSLQRCSKKVGRTKVCKG